MELVVSDVCVCVCACACVYVFARECGVTLDNQFSSEYLNFPLIQLKYMNSFFNF